MLQLISFHITCCLKENLKVCLFKTTSCFCLLSGLMVGTVQPRDPPEVLSLGGGTSVWGCVRSDGPPVSQLLHVCEDTRQRLNSALITSDLWTGC